MDFQKVRTAVGGQMVKFGELLRQPIVNKELAVSENSVWKKDNKWSQFTDDLLTQRKGFQVYEDMMNDPQVASCINTLKILRLANGYSFKAASEDNEDIIIKDFVEWSLTERINGLFRDDLREMLSAIDFGWSLSEKNWAVQGSGKYKDKIILESLKSKNPKYFNVWTDEFDNIKPNGIILLSTADYGKELPTDKFVVFSYNKRYENVFGTSKLRPAYRLWFLKNTLMRAFGIYYEKYGVPPIYAQYTGNIGQTKMNEWLNILKQMRFESAAVIPKEMDIIIKEISKGGSGAFIEFFRYADDIIAKLILGQTLTSSAGPTGLGSNLADVHYDILLNYINEIGEMLADVVNKQVIKYLVNYNFANVEYYPKLVFTPIEKDNITAIVDNYIKAKQGGVLISIPQDEEYIRKNLNLPERDIEALTGNTAPVVAKTPGEMLPAPVTSAQEFAEKIFTGVRRRTFTVQEKRVDFAEIKRTFQEDGIDEIMPKLNKITHESILAIYRWIEKEKLLEGTYTQSKVDLINNMKVGGVGEVKSIVEDYLTRFVKEGQKSARREVRAGLQKFVEGEIALSNLTPQEVLNVMAQRSYLIAGNYKTNISNLVKTNLVNAVKSGYTLKQTVDSMDTVLRPFLGSGGVAEESLNEYRLERVVRTSFTEAFNEGRKNMFLTEELRADVPALQISAILDDRVTPICEDLDGAIILATSPLLDLFTPPYQWNCRTLLIPVIAGDEYEVTPESKFNKWKEQVQKFKGGL